MEDFYYAGRVPAVISQLRDKLHDNVMQCNGKTLSGRYLRPGFMIEQRVHVADAPSSHRFPRIWM